MALVTSAVVGATALVATGAAAVVNTVQSVKASKEANAISKQAAADTNAATAKQDEDQKKLIAEEKKRVDDEKTQASLLAARDLASSRFRQRTAAQGKAASTILSGGASALDPFAGAGAPSTSALGGQGKTLLGG